VSTSAPAEDGGAEAIADAGAGVVMYATGWCPYCARARNLLAGKGVAVREIDIDGDPAARAQMLTRSGQRTVPQIFINGTHVGGCDDLVALDTAGGLDELLQGVAIK
jgi:glutaredoxin 3